MKYLLTSLAVLCIVFSVDAQKGNYHISQTFHIASGGGWDYLIPGPGNNQLYVSHGTQVNVLNELSGDSVGIITNTPGVHGIAFVPSLNKGYTSNGRANNLSVFDLKTNQTLKQIEAGQNPDAIMYEPFSKMLIVCNGRSQDLSIIDPVAEKSVATIAVGGKPETAVSDGAGKLFVNIEDKNEIVCVDLKTNTVTAHWPLQPAEGPTGLAIDRNSKRLFAGCDKKLAVIDYTNGKVVATVPIGDGCDGVAFDNSTKNIFAACGEGKLDIIHEDSPDKYTATASLPTKKSARTITINESLHRIYLPAADLGTPAAGERRAPMIPGTFQVLVVEAAK